MTTSFLTRLPEHVKVIEVGPRDGLQNQSTPIPVDLKAEWIRRLTACGFEEIEVTSFVHPQWVPQLADAAELVAILPRDAVTLYSVLVPNRTGLERALASDIERIALFTAASETFNQRNINCSIAESLARFREIFAAIAAAGRTLHVRGYISTCFGCPYEGAVDPAAVEKVAGELLALGCAEIAVSDTTGVAHPRQVLEVVERVAHTVPLESLALHFHDTRGLALANVLAGLEAGVTTFDSAGGGLGGCPYAPGAAGNLATEDLVHLLHSLSVDTGIDLDQLMETDLWFETHFQSDFPGRMLAAARHRRG